MNVLIDANVVFDVVEKRQPHYAASNQVLCLCRRRVLAGMVAYHTVANIFYQYGKAAVPFLDLVFPWYSPLVSQCPPRPRLCGSVEPLAGVDTEGLAVAQTESHFQMNASA